MGIPANIVIMWSGAIQDIPGDWFLCDGQNGTPNLVNRFVVGAGNTYSLDTTGGSANAVVVSHTHTASNTNTDGNHTHNVSAFLSTECYNISENDRIIINNNSFRGANGAQNFVGTTTLEGGSHSHSFNIVTAGESGVGKNMPPYYSLAYIMKGAE